MGYSSRDAMVGRRFYSKRTHRPGSRLRVFALTAVALLLMLVAACSSQSGSSSQGSSSSSALSLTVAGLTPAYSAPIYVALNNGYFAKNHVKVTLIDNQPPGATDLVVSGRVDIASQAAAPQTLLLTEQGKQAYITYGGIHGGIGGSLLAKPGLTLASLQKLPNCQIATWPPGTSAYGWAVMYKKELGLSNCTFTVYNTPQLDIAAVASGRADAVIGSSTNFAALVSDGKADFLINTANTADRAKYIPNPPAWEGVDYGLKSNLQKKAAAVKAYYAGYQEAIAWIAAHGAAATAAIVLKYPAAKGQTLSQLTTSIAAIAPFRAGGHVSPTSWSASLTAYATWGLTGFTSSNPLFAYANMIDPSAPAGS